MTTLYGVNDLPEPVREKLHAVRSRVIVRTLLAGGLAVALGALIACAMAMYADYRIMLVSTPARVALTLGTFAVTATVLVWWLFLPLWRVPGVSGVARRIDESDEEFEERMQTVTSLSLDSGLLPISPSIGMAQEVRREAAERSARVDSRRIVSWVIIRRLGVAAGTAMAIAIVFAIARPHETSALLQRLANPFNAVTVTRLAVEPGDREVMRGAAATIEVKRIAGPAAPITLWIVEGSVGLRSFQLRASDQGEAMHAIAALHEPVRYRVEAGDAVSTWHTLTPVDPPSIQAALVRVTPPAYTGRRAIELDRLPRELKVIEGSSIEVLVLPSPGTQSVTLEPVGRNADGSATQTPQRDDAGWHRFELRPEESFAFRPQLTGENGLTATTPQPTTIDVAPDAPPSVRIVTPEDRLAVRPDEVVPVRFEARDDVGLATAQLEVTTRKADGSEQTHAIPIPMGEQQGEKQFNGQAQLDLGALGVEDGDQVTYAIRVTDTHQASASAQSSSEETAPARAQSPHNNANPREQEQDQPRQARADDSTTPASQDQPPQQASTSPSASANTPEERQASAKQGTSPPPNPLSRRELNIEAAGTCSSSKTLIVDQFAGSYNGQSREKDRIDIDGVLKRLTAELEAAAADAETLQRHVDASESWSEPQVQTTGSATSHLSAAGESVSQLMQRSAGTPYAWVGLQLEDIDVSHIVPARGALHGVLAATGIEPRRTGIEDARHHIGQALLKLADMTRRYEAVKLEENREEMLVRLSVMHQVFVEDMGRMLGSQKPMLNRYDTGFIEVDEEFVKELEEMLRRKREALAELSKLLAEDPDLLQRFMAASRLESTTIRDQLTLLRQRHAASAREVETIVGSSSRPDPMFVEAMRREQHDRLMDHWKAAGAAADSARVWAPKVDPRPDIVNRIQTDTKQIAVRAGMLAADAQGGASGGLLSSAESLRDRVTLLDDTIGETMHEKHEAAVMEYLGNRKQDTMKLVGRYGGWIDRYEAIQSGRLLDASSYDRREMVAEATLMGEKLITAASSMREMPAPIPALAEKLSTTISTDLVAVLALGHGATGRGLGDDAVHADTEAQRVFGQAEQQFDELIRAIIKHQENQPPPEHPTPPKTSEEIVKMLEHELKACEMLGIPCIPMNVMVYSDWSVPGSGEGQGSGSGSGAGSGTGQGQGQGQSSDQAQGQAQGQAGQGGTPGPASRGMSQSQAAAMARAAQAHAQQSHRIAQQQATAARDRARAMQPGDGSGNGPAFTLQEHAGVETRDWNVLASQLREQMVQDSGEEIPEQYRAAIESYLQRLAQQLPPVEGSPRDAIDVETPQPR